MKRFLVVVVVVVVGAAVEDEEVSGAASPMVVNVGGVVAAVDSVSPSPLHAASMRNAMTATRRMAAAYTRAVTASAWNIMWKNQSNRLRTRSHQRCGSAPIRFEEH